MIVLIMIHEIFSLTYDWSRRVKENGYFSSLRLKEYPGDYFPSLDFGKLFGG